MSYKIILYYNYVDIEDPQELMNSQRELCEKLDLKGRVIIAHEGINGTLEGSEENIKQYVDNLLSDPRFKETHMKYSDGIGDAFPKLSIKVKDEIVRSELDERVNPNKITGKHITAEELHELFQSGQEFYIIDMRNDYEHNVGHFKDSILPAMKSFRDLPKTLKDMSHLKDKKIVTVCTGGVRCEKASGYLLTKGFKDVSQLYGGIVTYMEKYPNENFLGELYVFDKRVIMGFNLEDKKHKVIGKCEHCGKASNNFVNCQYMPCNTHFICCEECFDKQHDLALCGKCEKERGKLLRAGKVIGKAISNIRSILSLQKAAA